MLEDHEEILTIINNFTKKLRNLISATKLSQLTPLSAEVENDTRWPSTYKVVTSYLQIAPIIKTTSDHEIESLIPTDDQEAELPDLYVMLSQLDTVTKYIESENITVGMVRRIFDE